MRVKEEMRLRLEQAFAPVVLELYDESESHRGHAGYQEGGESHWRLVIEAPALTDMSRVARHRAIHEALGDIMGRIHALSIEVKAP